MKSDDVSMNCVYAAPEVMTSKKIYNENIIKREYPFNYGENDNFEDTVRMCVSCGNVVPLDANYCPYCGKSLKQSL